MVHVVFPNSCLIKYLLSEFALDINFLVIDIKIVGASIKNHHISVETIKMIFHLYSLFLEVFLFHQLMERGVITSIQESAKATLETQNLI